MRTTGDDLKRQGTMGQRLLMAGLAISLFLPDPAWAQDRLDQLLNRLGGAACLEEYRGLFNLEESDDPRQRVQAIADLLEHRDAIHARTDQEPSERIQTICDALHLLGEYDLPQATAAVAKFDSEGNWEVRERIHLAFIAAKKGIRYEANVTRLLDVLSEDTWDAGAPSTQDVAWVIGDVCTALSFLGKLFVLRGDTHVLNELFSYASVTFGFPAEYLSDVLVHMFLERPDMLISALGERQPETIHRVVNSLVFGVRSEGAYGKICRVLEDALIHGDGANRALLDRLRARLDALPYKAGADPEEQAQ